VFIYQTGLIKCFCLEEEGFNFDLRVVVLVRKVFNSSNSSGLIFVPFFKQCSILGFGQRLRRPILGKPIQRIR
jgi:hypothetical protein